VDVRGFAAHANSWTPTQPVGAYGQRGWPPDGTPAHANSWSSAISTEMEDVQACDRRMRTLRKKIAETDEIFQVRTEKRAEGKTHIGRNGREERRTQMGGKRERGSEGSGERVWGWATLLFRCVPFPSREGLSAYL
jgi:hypothetical protein